LLILPDKMRMGDSLREKINAFLQSGGSVLSAGLGALDSRELKFALPQWNFEVAGEKRSTDFYFKWAGEKFPCAMYSKLGIEMQAPDADCVYANAVAAHFERKWDGFHGHYYTPPAEEIRGVAAARIGNICHISFGIFEAYYETAYAELRALVKRCIDDMLPDPCIICRDIPSTSRITLTQNNRYTLLHVKVTYPEKRGLSNVIDSHNELQEGKEISVKGCYRCAYCVPSRQPIKIRTEGNRTAVTLPAIKGYTCIALEK